MNADITLKEKAVLRDAAQFALDVLIKNVRDDEGPDNVGARQQAIAVLKAALLASA